jgi:hypothetical protein
VGENTKPCGCRLCARSSTLLLVLVSRLRKCTVTESPTLHSITGPGMVPMVPPSVGSGSFRSQGLTFRSSGASQFAVYRRRIRASSSSGLCTPRLLVTCDTGDVMVHLVCPKFSPVMRSAWPGARSQQRFSNWIQYSTATGSSSIGSSGVIQSSSRTSSCSTVTPNRSANSMMCWAIAAMSSSFQPLGHTKMNRPRDAPKVFRALPPPQPAGAVMLILPFIVGPWIPHW